VTGCDPGFGDCNLDPRDGCEVDFRVSPLHCGTCANACSTPNATPACTAGQCGIGQCNPGYLDCNGSAADGCETVPASDTANCGGCGVVCSANHAVASCRAGQCEPACGAGFADCNSMPNDGCEADITGDTLHCGGCAIACSTAHLTPLCEGGACDGPCDAGYADCNSNKRVDGCEISVQTDPANCGGCGTVCSGNHVATPACRGGRCAGTCDAGFADCNANLEADGCEVNSLTDVMNCGACGTVCPGAQ
jgi:hypothetical protein